MNLVKIIKLRNLILSLMAYEKQIHLKFTFKVISWHCVHVSLLSYFSHSVSFFFINSFIASLFLLTHTLFLCTSLKQLLSLSISLFYSPYRYYFVIVSRYLTLSFTFSLFGATSDYSSLYLCDIILVLLSFLL